jgi:hypothetical protein
MPFGQCVPRQEVKVLGYRVLSQFEVRLSPQSGRLVRGRAADAAADWRQAVARKKRSKAAAVSFGISSGKKWPAWSARPWTSSPQARQSASGPPASAYQLLNAPRPLQSTRSGQAMRRPRLRSASSCTRSRVAAARYSSQMAWTRTGSRSASTYAARTSGPKTVAGEP